MIANFLPDLPSRSEALIGLPLAQPSRKRARWFAKQNAGKRFSASTVVDLSATTDYQVSLSIGSGSNTVVGGIVDLGNSNLTCNLWIAGGPGSGPVQLQVQTSPGTTSGSFVDATSGLTGTNFPSTFVSGGNVFFNSGLYGSGNMSDSAVVNNSPQFCSGGFDAAYFQRVGRYVRIINVSGSFPQTLIAGFISNKKETGSGGGQSQLPGSGAISV